MKYIPFLGLFIACIASTAFVFFTPNQQNNSEELKWYTWEEAVELNKKTPKKIIVDVFTDWCGWCKKMDKSTFIDPKVTAYLAQNFYPVKLNAEQRADINFNGERFAYVDTGNGRGVHTLAYALLDGNMSYPTVVYLNEKFERIMISPGFKDAEGIMTELTFAAEEHYTKQSFQDYQKNH
ncbi:MAG: DUF255 domain-containing protein [Bacteroidetes bacterium]|nr:DUF255 domain-containing protein [Bacteroidota bacterium]